MVFIFIVILVAYVFDFINGFHDAANSIATIVTTGVLSPRQAVIWAAFFNFIAFLLLKLSVAEMIGTGLINPNVVDAYFIFSALIGSIIWNLVTWYFGFPSSSSHALIGGMVGAALVKGGIQSIIFPGFIKIIVAIFLSPLLGLMIALLLIHIFKKLMSNVNERVTNQWFKGFQLLSSALLSISHGGNDAQKTMGIIALLLYSGSFLGNKFYVPLWVVISCQLFIALGTLFGGWRIVHTVGQKITHLNPMRGCCAETGAAIVILGATNLGIPVSTTHIVTGAVAGVGLSQSIWGVQWSMMRRIFLAWLFTIPATAILSATLMLIKIFFK